MHVLIPACHSAPGLKGRYLQVDPRQKKDKRAMKVLERRAKKKKGRSK